MSFGSHEVLNIHVGRAASDTANLFTVHFPLLAVPFVPRFHYGAHP